MYFLKSSNGVQIEEKSSFFDYFGYYLGTGYFIAIFSTVWYKNLCLSDVYSFLRFYCEKNYGNQFPRHMSIFDLMSMLEVFPLEFYLVSSGAIRLMIIHKHRKVWLLILQDSCKMKVNLVRFCKKFLQALCNILQD